MTENELSEDQVRALFDVCKPAWAAIPDDMVGKVWVAGPRLKPCPFCGRAVKIIHVEPSGYNFAYFFDEYAVAIVHADEGEKCIIDNLMSCNKRDRLTMIKLWNKRVKE